MRVVGQNWKSLSDSAKIVRFVAIFHQYLHYKKKKGNILPTQTSHVQDFNGEAATLRQKQREQMDRYLLSRTANDVAIERKKMFLRKVRNQNLKWDCFFGFVF